MTSLRGAAGDEAIYTYDGEGRRVLSSLRGAAGAEAISYLYDGMSVILERNSSGATTASYVRNPLAPGGIGGIISSTTGAQNYYHYDGIGTVTVLSNASGVSTQTYTYDAFGNTLAQTGTATNNRNFLTKQTDSTGLVFFGARYYDPRIGRFISRDPSGMSDGPNVYLYCLNNPVNLIDSYGLCLSKAGDWIWKNIFEPPYNALTQPGYNYAEWVYGEKNLRTYYGASLDSIWLVSGIYSAISAVNASRAPYWQYYPAENPAYQTKYMTRGWQPPYSTGKEATKALNLPQHNPGTAVREVKVPWWKYIAGPQKVPGGTGYESYDGLWFPSQE